MDMTKKISKQMTNKVMAVQNSVITVTSSDQKHMHISNGSYTPKKKKSWED